MSKFEEGYYGKEVEEILDCTSTERKRWLDEGKIKHNGKTGKIRTPYSSYNYVDLYDKNTIDSITTDAIETWREEHKKIVSENRKRAAKKATATRAKNKQTKINNDTMIEQWKSLYGEEQTLLFNYAYWTYKISEMTDKMIDRYVRDGYYALKNNAIVKMLKYSEMLIESDLFLDENGKVSAHLCKKHLEEFKEWWYMIDGGPWSAGDINAWAQSNKKEIEKCNGCLYHDDKKYYSLFKFTFKLGENVLLLNMPYPIGQRLLPKHLLDLEITSKMCNAINIPEFTKGEAPTAINEKYIKDQFQKSEKQYLEFFEK